MQPTAPGGPIDATPQDPFTDRDPAERTLLRYCYRNRRPTRLGHYLSRLWCWWSRMGLPPRFVVALEVRDRVSGRMRADAVVVVTLDGHQYIVSMFGTISDWVHNLEASGGDAVICQGSSRPVRLMLIQPEERALILREFVRIATSGRKHFPLPVEAPLSDFAAIAAQYPVYRIQRRDNAL